MKEELHISLLRELVHKFFKMHFCSFSAKIHFVIEGESIIDSLDSLQEISGDISLFLHNILDMQFLFSSL